MRKVGVCGWVVEVAQECRAVEHSRSTRIASEKYFNIVGHFVARREVTAPSRIHEIKVRRRRIIRQRVPSTSRFRLSPKSRHARNAHVARKRIDIVRTDDSQPTRSVVPIRSTPRTTLVLDG